MHADNHPIQAIRHVDSEAAGRWYADQTAKLTAAGYNWLGFTTHGATWRHPDHGDLHIMHGVSNPADKSDDAIYSTIKHGDKPADGGDKAAGKKEPGKSPAGDFFGFLPARGGR